MDKENRIRCLTTLILCVISLSTYSQSDDYEWWNQIHGWQPGMKGWKMFLIHSPKYLGPNALPVPELKIAKIPEKSEFEISADFHFKNGDPTQDLWGRCLIPFANSRIALELYGVAVEKYQMSEAIRDERFARDFDGKGKVVGDFYFSTLIQLVRGKKFPDAMLRLACKTASGEGYNAARVTDTPGYFFDLSLSKDIRNKRGNTLTPSGMIGFYCWQTNDDRNFQNDAWLYGAGLNYNPGKWLFTSTLTGFHGYKNNGDSPLVFTAGIKRDIGRKTFRVQYLHGLNDWEYDTFKFSLIWYFKGITN
jgi:hypothetical protein